MRQRLFRRRLGIVTLAGIVAALAAGAIAYATSADSNVIQGCYDSGGNLKVVQALPCPKGYTPLAWSQTGPAGQAGPAGQPGPAGPPGAAGAPGPAGTSGAAHAYSATDSHVIDQCCGGYQAIVRLSGLPAGSYVVWVTAEDFSSALGVTDDIDAFCNFKTGSGQFLDPEGSDFKVGSLNSDYPPANITDAVSLPANGSLVLACNTFFDHEGKTEVSGTITAIKVDQLN